MFWVWVWVWVLFLGTQISEIREIYTDGVDIRFAHGMERGFKKLDILALKCFMFALLTEWNADFGG